MPRILVVGSINMDVTIFTRKIPEQGETLPGSGFLLSPGGKGANQAVAAARMGADTSFVGCVGDDVFGEQLAGVLKADGIRTEHLRRESGVSTGVASITVCEGDNRIILYDGANARVDVGRLPAFGALLRECDALLLQMEIPKETVLDAIELAHAQGTRVFLTPAPASPLPKAAYQKAAYLLPNEKEARVLLDMPTETDEDIFRALRAFRGLGVAHPLITLGERGVACIAGDEPVVRGGYRVNPVDSTAAGDTFAGAFAVAVAEGQKLLDAIDFAQRAAAICVTRPGAQVSIPTRDEAMRAGLQRQA